MQHQGTKGGIIYRRDVQKKNRSGGSTQALKVVELASNERLEKRTQVMHENFKKKMNDLEVDVEGRDFDLFSLCSYYGRK